MFSKGSFNSISFATETPSFVMRGAPKLFAKTTLRPLGPKVTLTALARIFAPCSIRFLASVENFTSLKDEICTYLDRDYNELSPIELAIIFSALYELKFHPDIPYRVVINEAIEVAESFGGSDGFKFINGVLNKAAKQNRIEEFTRSA